MRDSRYLAGNGKGEIVIDGDYIHYENGVNEIEIKVNGGIHVLGIGDTHNVKEGYESFEVANLDSRAGNFVFRVGKGELDVAGSGQLTSVSEIKKIVDVKLLNDVAVREMPLLSLSPVKNVEINNYSVPLQSAFKIQAREGRKRIVIQGYTPSLYTVLVRVSDGSATSYGGQILACGGGLMSEIEHKHEDELIVWNPSDLTEIELSVLEEF